jgi:tryptophan 2,3-dioxygenase
MNREDGIYYGDYLQLDKILTAQDPESKKNGAEAHDEMLFIIVHQAYELWFKQMKHEMESIISILNKPAVNDNSPDIYSVVHRLKRIASIWELAIKQVDVIETMTPLDFLDFRDDLRPASGFQSFQFKMLEAMMGLRFGERQGKDFYRAHLRPEHIEAIAEVEKNPSLMELTRIWLERMPFFNAEYWAGYQSYKGNESGEHPFWTDYKAAYAGTLSEMEMANLDGFDQLFFSDEFNEKRRLSPAANRSALFIMTYRDYPLLTLPFQLLDTLLEIDELMSTWRTRHIAMVHRMIGSRMGTGGSSGAEYLQKSRDSHFVFKELGDINSYLIQRNKLPKLSTELEKRLGFGA